jgi:uncharacterized protein with FMN-binding domain
LLITLIVVAVVVLLFAGLVFGGMRYVRNMTVGAVDLTQVADGTYRGDFSRGRFKFSVDVVVANHRIESITSVDAKSETEVTRKISEAIVSQQTVKVDVVSGATLTTKAYSKAVENALEKKK